MWIDIDTVDWLVHDRYKSCRAQRKIAEDCEGKGVGNGSEGMDELRRDDEERTSDDKREVEGKKESFETTEPNIVQRPFSEIVLGSSDRKCLLCMMIEGLDCAPTHEMFPPFIPIPFRPYLGLITRRQRNSVY